MGQLELGGYSFKGVCRIVPELDETGNPIEYSPQNEYENIQNFPLNEFGKGPFCRFRVPKGNAQTGVYAVVVDNDAKYVGECDNFATRWNMGYGNISPRNCYIGGQSTNCRINKLILSVYKSGKNIELYFHQSENRFQIEEYLISELNPEWNVKKIKSSRSNTHTKRAGINGRNRYLPLKEYLVNSQKNVETLSFDEIEEILEAKLPHSAYNYPAWWSNMGHQHASTWTDAGFKATSIKLGKSVTFRKE